MYFKEDAKYRKPKATEAAGAEKEIVIGEKERAKKTKKVEKKKQVEKKKKVEKTKKVEEQKRVEEQVREEEEEEGHYGLIMCMSF